MEEFSTIVGRDTAQACFLLLRYLAINGGIAMADGLGVLAIAVACGLARRR